MDGGAVSVKDGENVCRRESMTLLPPPSPTGRMRTCQRLGAACVLLVALVALPLVWSVTRDDTRSLAQHAVARAEILISSINVTSYTNDDVYVTQQEMVLGNPLSMHTHVHMARGSVLSLQGEVLSDIVVPNVVDLPPSSRTQHVLDVVVETHPVAFARALDEAFRNATFDYYLDAVFLARSEFALGDLSPGPIAVRRRLSLRSFNGLSTTVQDFVLLNKTRTQEDRIRGEEEGALSTGSSVQVRVDDMALHVDIGFNNSSVFCGSLPMLHMVAQYKGFAIAHTHSTSPMTLVSGSNIIYATGDMMDSAVLEGLVQDYMMGRVWDVQVRGDCAIEGDDDEDEHVCENVFDMALARMPLRTEIDGRPGVTVYMRNFTAVYAKPDRLGIKAFVVFHNPTDITGIFYGIRCTVYAQEDSEHTNPLGIVPMGNRVVNPADELIEADGWLIRTPLLVSILTDYLNGKDLPLAFHYDEPPFLQNVTCNFTMAGVTDDIVRNVALVFNFDTIVKILTEAVATVTGQFYNPLLFPFVVSNLRMDIYYNKTDPPHTRTLVDHVHDDTPFHVPARGVTSTEFTFHIPSFDVVRQYVYASDCGALCLKVDLFNGQFDMEVGGEGAWRVTLHFGCDRQQHFCNIEARWAGS